MSDLPYRYPISISHIDIGSYLVTLLDGEFDMLTSVYLFHELPYAAQRNAVRQGLTLVHFSAQPEPFLTQNTP